MDKKTVSLEICGTERRKNMVGYRGREGRLGKTHICGAAWLLQDDKKKTVNNKEKNEGEVQITSNVYHSICRTCITITFSTRIYVTCSILSCISSEDHNTLQLFIFSFLLDITFMQTTSHMKQK